MIFIIRSTWRAGPRQCLRRACGRGRGARSSASAFGESRQWLADEADNGMLLYACPRGRRRGVARGFRRPVSSART